MVLGAVPLLVVCDLLASPLGDYAGSIVPPLFPPEGPVGLAPLT